MLSGVWVLILLVLISSLPVIAVYVWFRLAKYPLSLVKFLLILFAGASAFFPALLLQDLLNLSFAVGNRWMLFYEFFIRLAFTEEISRLLMLFIFFWISGMVYKLNRAKQGEDLGQPLTYNTIKKGTAIGLVAGLGFALLETATLGASNADLTLLLLRAVTTAPLHAACGSRIGAAAVLFRTSPVQAIMRIFTATAIHGVYNIMLDNEMPWGLPFIAAILIALSALATAILTIRGGWEQPTPEEPPTLDKIKESQ